MKVKEIMTASPGFCYGVDSLTRATWIMWDRDCGSVPVLDAENKVIGMITDRDICIAVASRDQKPSEIKIGELCQGRRIFSCGPDDELRKAIKLMRKNQVRRLPVINDQGHLEGVITLADIVAQAGTKKGKSGRKKVFLLVEAITKKPPIRLMEVETEKADKERPEEDSLDDVKNDKGNDE